jgi:predicted ester cyclase
VIAEGDTVAATLRFTGTHQGEFAGMPATGRRATVAMTEMTRFRDGKCCEHWGVADMAGLMAQLGATPGGGL